MFLLSVLFFFWFHIHSEDADTIRLHTLSEAGDMDSLEKMVNDSDSEDAEDEKTEGKMESP